MSGGFPELPLHPGGQSPELPEEQGTRVAAPSGRATGHPVADQVAGTTAFVHGGPCSRRR